MFGCLVQALGEGTDEWCSGATTLFKPVLENDVRRLALQGAEIVVAVEPVESGVSLGANAAFSGQFGHVGEARVTPIQHL